MTPDERNDRPSASSMERLALCPGSHLMSREHGQKSESDDSRRGDRIHEWLAGSTIELDPEERELAELCHEQADRLVADYLGDNNAEVRIIREERIWDASRAWSGKPDLVSVYRDHALVVDYKTGRGDVAQAAGNMQLRALAVLVAEKHAVRNVRVAIVQPLAGRPTVCDYDDSDLWLAEGEIIDIVINAETPGRPRNPGPQACKYCPAKSACPEARGLVVAMAQPVAAQGQSITLTAEEIGDFLSKAKAAEAVIESVRAHARALLAAGETIPGWRLKPGTQRETITDPQTVFDRVSALGCDAPKFLSVVSVPKGKLETVVRELTGEKGKALKARMDSILDGVTETTTAAPMLAQDKESA